MTGSHNQFVASIGEKTCAFDVLLFPSLVLQSRSKYLSAEKFDSILIALLNSAHLNSLIVSSGSSILPAKSYTLLSAILGPVVLPKELEKLKEFHLIALFLVTSCRP